MVHIDWTLLLNYPSVLNYLANIGGRIYAFARAEDWMGLPIRSCAQGVFDWR